MAQTVGVRSREPDRRGRPVRLRVHVQGRADGPLNRPSETGRRPSKPPGCRSSCAVTPRPRSPAERVPPVYRWIGWRAVALRHGCRGEILRGRCRRRTSSVRAGLPSTRANATATWTRVAELLADPDAIVSPARDRRPVPRPLYGPRCGRGLARGRSASTTKSERPERRRELSGDISHAADRGSSRFIWHGDGHGPESCMEATSIYTVRDGKGRGGRAGAGTTAKLSSKAPDCRT